MGTEGRGGEGMMREAVAPMPRPRPPASAGRSCAGARDRRGAPPDRRAARHGLKPSRRRRPAPPPASTDCSPTLRRDTVNLYWRARQADFAAPQSGRGALPPAAGGGEERAAGVPSPAGRAAGARRSGNILVPAEGAWYARRRPAGAAGRSRPAAGCSPQLRRRYFDLQPPWRRCSAPTLVIEDRLCPAPLPADHLVRSPDIPRWM